MQKVSIATLYVVFENIGEAVGKAASTVIVNVPSPLSVIAG